MALHGHESGAEATRPLAVRPQLTHLGEVGEIPHLRLPDRGMPADSVRPRTFREAEVGPSGRPTKRRPERSPEEPVAT